MSAKKVNKDLDNESASALHKIALTSFNSAGGKITKASTCNFWHTCLNNCDCGSIPLQPATNAAGFTGATIGVAVTQ